MTFTIDSKFNVGEVVSTLLLEKVTIIEVKLRMFDYYVKFMYLVEYENGARSWKSEDELREATK